MRSSCSSGTASENTDAALASSEADVTGKRPGTGKLSASSSRENGEGREGYSWSCDTVAGMSLIGVRVGVSIGEGERDLGLMIC